MNCKKQNKTKQWGETQKMLQKQLTSIRRHSNIIGIVHFLVYVRHSIAPKAESADAAALHIKEILVIAGDYFGWLCL